MIAFILSLDYSSVISGSTTHLKKYIYCSLLYSASQPIFFLSDSLSSDYTAYLRRSASKTKCTVNGAIVRADRKSRVKNGVHPTRPGPKFPRFITPPLLSCRVLFRSVLLKRLVVTTATKYELRLKRYA